MSAEKRPAVDDPGSSQMLVKRQNVTSSEGAVARLSASSSVVATARTSSLLAPVMQLTGHSGEIFAAKFDPTGDLIASGSMDRSIMLWRTYGECENYGLLNGHKGAILDLQWSRDSGTLFSASADTHLASWDVELGTRVRRYVGHEEVVNAVDVSRRGAEKLVSGSDDSTIGVWDPRTRKATDYIQTDFPITAVAISEDGNILFSGGIDNDVTVWDLRNKSVKYSLLGHTDTIMSVRLSKDNTCLASYAMDSTVRTWDVSSFSSRERRIRTFDGADKGFEQNLLGVSWNPDGKRIAAGSADGTALVWSTDTGKLLYKLPGHKGAVNCVDFSPANEPILLSASSDRTILLGELK
ncbi:hypothetical protein CP533_1172 [Ophiocordyceps camponoti-saundersi (nom. inval.)]|nr:hypothetical protein CP533_1172 [Ophiocordyceps camponoti-saundersi (nom. inval.)]